MIRIVLLVLCTIIMPSAWSSASDEVQAKLNAIRSMTAKFNQVVKAGKRDVSDSSGSMALERPGRFRWQTISPMEQIIVADSQRLWVYDVDLEQVTVKKQEKGIGGTPALFLSGYNDTVARDFEVTSGQEDSKVVYDMKAKSNKENYQRIKLFFKGDTLTDIEFFDQLGQHTIVHLTKIKNNPGLDAKLFTFKPPKGVDVVEQ